MVLTRFFLVFTLLVLVCPKSLTQTMYQWRYDRSGSYPETGLLTKWAEGGPQLRWTFEKLPKGFSSPTVTPDAIFITGIVDTSDVLVALSKQGEVKWTVPYGNYWRASYQDSRCTPTVAGNDVYVSSGNGDIACIDAVNGNIVWKVAASEKYHGTYGEWGITESLLVDGDRLFFTPGGEETTMIALNRNNGQLIWKSESIHDNPAYVSPVLIEISGKKMIVTVTASYIFAVNPVDGKIIWKVKHLDINSESSRKVWEDAPKVKCVTPLYSDGYLYITGGYNHGGAMFQLTEDGTMASLAWSDTVLDVHHGGVVLVNGYIYGSNWISNGDGNWCCIDWKTGRKMYEEHWNCKGSLIAAQGMLFLYDEKKGSVGLVNATPEKLDVISSFRVTKGSGPHWAHPVISDGILYIRHGNALMAYDIKK
jgi:outer membrane protein assembly factor BamB